MQSPAARGGRSDIGYLNLAIQFAHRLPLGTRAGFAFFILRASSFYSKFFNTPGQQEDARNVCAKVGVVGGAFVSNPKPPKPGFGTPEAPGYHWASRAGPRSAGGWCQFYVGTEPQVCRYAPYRTCVAIQAHGPEEQGMWAATILERS